MKPFCSAKWWTFISQWSKFHFPIFSSETQGVDLFFFSILMFTSVQSLVCPQIFWTCFWARHRNKISRGNSDFISTICFKNVTDHHDQQIVLRKTWNLELCFKINKGTNRAKIEKIRVSIFRAIRLELLRPLVSVIRCEANKSNLLPEERPSGSRTVQMLMDLLLNARGLAQHVAAAKTSAPKWEPHMHNRSIWCQGPPHTIGCVMAHSKTWPARGEPTEQNSTCGGGNVDRSVDSAWFLAFTR